MVISSPDEFLNRVDLERRLLAELVELPPMKALSSTYDLGGPNSGSGVMLFAATEESVSGQAIAEFKGRTQALYFAAAWKILDSLVELALSGDPAFTGADAWTPKKKTQLLEGGAGVLAQLPPDILAAVVSLYIQTVPMRHAFAHRKVTVGDAGALIGHANDGTPMSPAITPDQQTDLCELAQWLSLAIEAGGLTSRQQRRCRALLAALTPLHGAGLANPPVKGEVESVKYELEADNVFDIAKMRARLGKVPFAIDVQLFLHDGTILVGELDEVSDQVLTIDLAHLPPWLRVFG